jgi:hypothetical protein
MSRTTGESRKEGSSLAGRVWQLAFVAWILLVNLMDPAQVQAPDAMLELLTNLNVRWIVKTREYPEDLARPLLALEQQGKLLPIASTDVENRTGTGRIYNETEKLHVVLFRVTEGNEK